MSGLKWKFKSRLEMKHYYRAKWHDYKSRCIYLITLMKREGVPAFGSLAGDCSIKWGNPGCAFIRSSDVGNAVKKALREIPKIEPAIRVLQYALMPDHLHIVLFVEREMDEILGRKLAAFKVMVNGFARIDSVFEKGFDDQILRSDRKLDVIYDYLRQNAHRLAVRWRYPRYFRRVNNMRIGGHLYQAYGNLLLLRNPFMEAVVVHRKYSDEERARLREEWLHTACNGGVLISAFVSPVEKDIRREAEAEGARIILITDRPFGERGKPAKSDFEKCEEGKLLVLVPMDEDFPRDSFRASCLAMNERAGGIASMEPARRF